jgi:hypothetical protein
MSLVWFCTLLTYLGQINTSDSTVDFNLFGVYLYIYDLCISDVVGQDSSVGIAKSYELDGPGIESPEGGHDFPHMSRPPRFLYNGYRVFPGGRAAGAWR